MSEDVRFTPESPWMRGIRISVSFSCPSELLTKIEEKRADWRTNLSKTVAKLIMYGLVYVQVLQEQQAIDAKETKKPRKKKKAKPKTSSK